MLTDERSDCILLAYYKYKSMESYVVRFRTTNESDVGIHSPLTVTCPELSLPPQKSEPANAQTALSDRMDLSPENSDILEYKCYCGDIAYTHAYNSCIALP